MPEEEGKEGKEGRKEEQEHRFQIRENRIFQRDTTSDYLNFLFTFTINLAPSSEYLSNRGGNRICIIVNIALRLARMCDLFRRFENECTDESILPGIRIKRSKRDNFFKNWT